MQHDGQFSKSEQPLEESVLDLEIAVIERVNFASAQNNVAVLKSLSVISLSDEAVAHVHVRMFSEPAIFREKTWTIDRIKAEGKLTLQDLETPLDLERLGRLDEAETGDLIFEIKIDGESVKTIRKRIELLARDEWGGLGDMAHLLAAFV